MQKLAEVCKSAVDAELTVHVKQKAEDGGQHMDEIIKALQGSASEPLIGTLPKVVYSELYGGHFSPVSQK